MFGDVYMVKMIVLTLFVIFVVVFCYLGGKYLLNKKGNDKKIKKGLGGER